MKESTQLITLLMFEVGSKGGKRVVLESKVKDFVQPGLQLSNSGWRSLLHHLETKGLINSQLVASEKQLSLTTQGQDALVSQFPALEPKWEDWDGGWLEVVFQSPPKGDKRFRYLRSSLLKLNSIQLSRGVYLVPSYHEESIKQVCSRDYQGNVAVIKLGGWLVGDLGQQVSDQMHLEDIATTLSGISSELDDLLDDKKRSGRAKHQQKNDFSSVFNRFWDVLGEVPGYLTRYIKLDYSARQLLSRLQNTFDSYF